MLQNIQELRATNWVSRRVTDAPKTIGEIHKEAKQEEMQMQMAHLQQAAQKRSSGKGDFYLIFSFLNCEFGFIQRISTFLLNTGTTGTSRE